MPPSALFKPLALSALLLIGAVAGADEQSVLTLKDAAELAAQDNPDLAQLQARAQAMAAIPSQAGTLPDPELSFNAMSLPVDNFNPASEDMAQFQVGISQALPFPGKLALRERAASFETAAALQNVTEARWWLQKNVKTIWWGIFYLDHALQIIDSNQVLLRQFIQITRTKYEVGEGLQQEVLLAQLELSKLLDQQLKFEGSRRNLAAQLNVLLDRPANLAVTLPDKVQEQLPAIMAEAGLYRLAESARALLAVQRENIQAAQSRLELAKKDYLPDFMVDASYGARTDTLAGDRRSDLLSLGVRMNVPIFIAGKQAKAVDQRTSELMQQKYALQDQWNQVRGQISQAHSDYRRAREQSELFKTGIIPQARQTVASMLAGYQVNKVDFLNLLQSQITLFNYEMQYWNAFTEAQQALAQLTAMVGQEEIYE